jgi:CTP:molybdopterin cytidylyltransferase MocA
MRNKTLLESRKLVTETGTGRDKPRPYKQDVAAIILAAGRSQRMGAFKPLLAFGATTVIETCIANIRGGGVGTIVVVIGEGPRAEALRDRLQNSDVTIAVNPHPESEMGASIAYGVRALSATTRAVIINPVDHAAVPAKVVGTLIDEWKKGAPLVKPTWNERGGHPVLIDLAFRDELLNLDPDGGLKTFFDRHRDQAMRVGVDSNYIARDMDTWDDYRALHQDVFGSLPPEQVPLEGQGKAIRS